MSDSCKTCGTTPTVHKTIVPAPKEGFIDDLVLCWSKTGGPPPNLIRHARFTRDINDANCQDCWALWEAGIYS